ncbi:MAG: hypothetical protein BroJett024_12950 [Alphaproteobacteria bacterium]|nr:MAG: hypothetical protein BroJett024_12950 [Alphaproteobacteria bacterium]
MTSDTGPDLTRGEGRDEKRGAPAAGFLRSAVAPAVVWFFRALFLSTERGRRALAWLTGKFAASPLAVMLLAHAPERRQLLAIRLILKYSDPAVHRALAENVRSRAIRSADPRLWAAYDLVLAHAPGLIASWEDFVGRGGAKGEAAEPRPTSHALAIAAYELARYKDAVAAFLQVRDAGTEAAYAGHDFAKAAYAAGKIRNRDLAMEFFARQFGTLGRAQPFGETERAAFLAELYHRTSAAIAPAIARRQATRGPCNRMGVFFISSTEALGHAILDPYYFLALRRNRDDHIVFVGPPRSAYRAASATCLQIAEQYGDYVESDDDFLLNLSWMSMGTLTAGALTFRLETEVAAQQDQDAAARAFGTEPTDIVIEHYWSLLREAVLRSRDAQDAFAHNRWHMQLPPAFAEAGRAFCSRHGIVLDRPLVVLHARDHGYHRIEKQDFRNAEIANYLPAVEHLLGLGYQVIRIGDTNMRRLPVPGPGFHELPFMDGYHHALDPFFIAHARFMIGCQSGPCSYARALGTPVLSVNAVLHYTLLPAVREMACFKRYIADGAQGVRELSLMDALAAGVYHFDNSYQFRHAGIRTQDASADEIVAAVRDMIAWLDNPDLPETAAQAAFRTAVADAAAALAAKGTALDLPIGDFLGIALPGYRLSPSVADMRAAYDKSRSG